MDQQQFWKIIDSSRRKAKGDPDAQIEALINALVALPEEDIIAFDRYFTELWFKAYTWDLWAAAYIIGGGCSDDGFMDFRGWLISKGQKVYEQALVDPESLAKVVKDEDEECQIEGFQYAAAEAWARKTGNDYEEFPHESSDGHPGDPIGKRWEEDALPKRFPRLWRKFGE